MSTSYVPDGVNAGLPSAHAAAQMTESAIEQSGQGAEATWIAAAEAACRALAEQGGPFSANDVWASGLSYPSNKRALGHVLRCLDADGVITRTGTHAVSRWGHGQAIAVWRKA